MDKNRGLGRVRLLGMLVGAYNEAVAIGLDLVAADLRTIIYCIIRKWDEELEDNDGSQ